MTKKEQQEQKSKEAKDFILSIIAKIRKSRKKPQLLIFIKSVSRSGMSRKMIVMLDNRDITRYVNLLLGNYNSYDYVNVGGCGMDMTFWLADIITYHLYGYKKPKWLNGNGGSCLDWNSIY